MHPEAGGVLPLQGARTIPASIGIGEDFCAEHHAGVIPPDKPENRF